MASDPSKADLGAMAGPMAGATSWSPDANATASGQLEKLLAKDNPLLQQARTRAAQKMNGMGLMNSSMAIGAGESAMYDVAIPIATNDAQTFAKAQSENAAAANQFAMQQNQFGQNAAMARFNGVLSLAAQDRDLQGKWAMQSGSQAWQSGENALERQNRLEMQTGQQGFQAWQAGLDRAQQLNVQQNQFGQNALDRAQQLAMQQNQFGFQGGQSALDRAQQLQMQSNQFGQNALDRAQQLAMQGNQFAFQGQQSAMDRQLQADLQSGRISADAVQSQLNREQQLRVQQLQEQGMDSRQASQIAASERQQREQQLFQGGQADKDRAQQLKMQLGDQQFRAVQSQLDREQQSRMQELQERGMDSRQAQQIASQERLQKEQNLLQRDELQYRKDATAAEMAFKNRDLDVRSSQWGKEQQAKQAELISQIRRQAAEARNRIETDDMDPQAKQTAIMALVDAADHDIAELIQASGIATPGYWPSWMRDTRYWDDKSSGAGGTTKTNTDTRGRTEFDDRVGDKTGQIFGDKSGQARDVVTSTPQVTDYYANRPTRDRAIDAASARKRGEEDRIWDDMRRRLDVGGAAGVGAGGRPQMMTMGGPARPGVLAQAASAGSTFGRQTGAPVRDPSLSGPGNGGRTRR